MGYEETIAHVKEVYGLKGNLNRFDLQIERNQVMEDTIVPNEIDIFDCTAEFKQPISK